MSDSFDITLLNSSAFIKKGYSTFVANAGKAVAVITLIIAVLLSFTEIGFSNASIEVFSSTLIMMLIASYVMYFSLEDSGEKLARESDEYKAAMESYQKIRSLVSGEDIKGLRKFCFDYQNEELEYRKKSALMSLGYTCEEYDNFKKGGCKDRRANKKLARIDNFKKISISASDLLAKTEIQSYGNLGHPGGEKLLFLLCRLLPSTVCMIFTITMMINAKDGLTFGNVMESVMKLSTLPIIGLKGYTAGYEYTLHNEVARLNIKADLLEAYIKQREK